jgi:glycosyltransferase involved in cell wall biosynthesis
MISIVLPTRKRPVQLKEMIDSALETADAPTKVEFCVYVDEDDVDTKQCIDDLSSKGFLVKCATSPSKINLSQMWNYAYENLSTGDIIMLCADDIRFRSRCWDTLVRNEFDKVSDKLVLVYGDDRIHGRNLTTHPFVHRRWIEKSGFWLPPYFVSDMVDVWLHEVSKALGRIVYLPNVVTEHLHFSVGKSQIDETTIQRLSNHNIQNPTKVYNEKIDERNEHISRLLRSINSD